MSKKTAALFLDNGDILSSFGEKARVRFDYTSYIKLMEEHFDFVTKRIYLARGKNDTLRFQEFVESLGFEVHTRDARYMRAANQSIYFPVWQVGLTLDVVQSLSDHKLDAVVLGVCNPAYSPLFDYVRNAGVGVYVTAARYPSVFDGKANLVDMDAYVASCQPRDGVIKKDEVVKTVSL